MMAHDHPTTAPARRPRTPAELAALAQAYRAQAQDGRRALPRTRLADRPGLQDRVLRLERLASELERAAARAEERAA